MNSTPFPESLKQNPPPTAPPSQPAPARALALLAELLAEGEPLRVQVEHGGLIAELTICHKAPACETTPARRIHAETIDEGAEPATCIQALIQMFRSTRMRKTAGTAHLWLQDHGFDYKKGTVEKYLGDLLKEGTLDNRNDLYGKGYGLAEWSQKVNEDA